MMQSMTAFARLQKELQNSNLCWEIKALNNRYLDLSFRLPEDFRFLETALRASLRGKINRGKLECQLKLKQHADANPSIKINEPFVNNLIATAEWLEKNKNIPNNLSLSSILALPGAFETEETKLDTLTKDIESLFIHTIDELVIIRKREGEALAEEIRARLVKLKVEVEKATKEVERHKNDMPTKLLAKIEEFQIEVDKSRLEQEIAFLLAKGDVSEELDRLNIHINEVEKALVSKEPAGRRLDFLMQELNREANTLSSKSDSSDLTKAALEMKVLIEQMREQIQNIE
ncbi:MAG: YicC family protein [Proteobacteria bacterium]|nr:YicC family protein [Pseudomonadota bacterium]